MNIRLARARYAWLATLLVAAACSDDGSRTADTPPVSSPIVKESPSSETTTTGAAAGVASSTSNVLTALPTRDGPRRETTHGVPHIQVDAEPVPDVDAELRRRVFLLPGIEERESQLSLPGARSLWLSDDLELERPEVLQSGREFGHFHPDGSLHLWLPVERAVEVATTKWGELHPWVGREDFWDGIVMIYVPETFDEANIALQLVVDAYNYIAGASLDPAGFD